MGRGKEEADWFGAPCLHFLLYLLHRAVVDLSSQQPWAQQANTGSERALSTQPSASSSSLPSSPATERDQDGACWSSVLATEREDWRPEHSRANACLA